MNKKEIFWGLMKKQIPSIIIIGVASGIAGGYIAYLKAKQSNLINQLIRDEEHFRKLAETYPAVSMEELDAMGDPELLLEE